MSERHRALPAWMAKKEVKEKKPLKSRRTRKTARAAFYCMNERELVEAAVSCLTNGACEDAALLADQKVEEKAVDGAVKVRENPAPAKTTAFEEESSDCGDDLDMTYVSETDLDTTEMETVPYTKSPEGQRSGPVEAHGGLVNAGLEAEEKEEHTQMPAQAAEEEEEEEEEDALRLVREIFFT